MSHLMHSYWDNATSVQHATMFLLTYCARKMIGAHGGLYNRIGSQHQMLLIAIEKLLTSRISEIPIHCQRSETAFDSIPIAKNATILSNTSRVTAVSYLEA